MEIIIKFRKEMLEVGMITSIIFTMKRMVYAII